MRPGLRVGSLFTGIGGLDLGLERAGMQIVWQSEIDPYACRVLAKHWPDVPNLGDITLIDWNEVPRVDIICGGYPCQPFSVAGVRRGADDPRHLWPYMLGAIRHLRPRHALLENVPGHLSMGFGRVLGDLAEIGYDVEWCSIPAAAVGAPHLRWRLFAVATDADRDRYGRGQNGRRMGRVDGRDEGAARQRQRARPLVEHRGATVADADGERQLQPRGVVADQWRRVGDGGRPVGDADVASADSYPATGSPRRPTGESGWWAVEPDVGRVAHGVPCRVDRLRCLGNAVVPQVAELVGQMILDGTLGSRAP